MLSLWLMLDSSDVIALHIAAQNAGFIMRHTGKNIKFESFEVSPTTSQVMKAKGRLVCFYPGPVIAVSPDIAQNDSFARNLATMLERMNIEPLKEAIPITHKATVDVSELRDTTDPKFITGMLVGLLRGLGQPVASDSGRLQKHIRDDVLWHKAQGPWRRSPFWLVLRVAMQTTLQDGNDHSLYKSLMAYFMASVLEQALDMKCTGDDTLFVMSAKLSRRALKFQGLGSDFVLSRVSEVVDKVRIHLQDNWAMMQKVLVPEAKWTMPDQHSLEEDTKLSLTNSKSYINTLLQRKGARSDSVHFKPSEVPRIPADGFNMPSGFGNKKEFELYLALYDVEKWVETRLNDWLMANSYREAACQELGALLKEYTETANKAYGQNPENLSIMLLTMMELWVALDKAAIVHCGLLQEYSPEIPTSLLEPILLPKKSQMKRLAQVESYVSNRRTTAYSRNPEILSELVNERTFAVKYFDQSSRHQVLRDKIEAQARLDREQKVEEFQSLRNDYHRLLRDATSRSHSFYEYTTYSGYHRSEHSSNCRKCELEHEAEYMDIRRHEWPLPSSTNILKLKAAVFELQCPISFSVWRDTTYRILVDFCMPESFTCSDADGGNIESYAGLKQYYANKNQRLSLWSGPKSFLIAHYHSCYVKDATIEDVCVPNALSWKLYDSERKGWVIDNLGKANVRSMCTFQLPAAGFYQKMQWFVDNSVHTSNEVIASQQNCSTELSLHEYEAFGELRAGHRLQWFNVARELRARALTWGNEPVGLLLMQTIWQAGPRHKELAWHRESHAEPIDLDFSRAILDDIHAAWDNIKDNWRESFSAHSLIALTARIMTCSESEEIKNKAAELLRKGREITLVWCRQLSEKLDASLDGKLDDHTIQTLRTRLIQVAAICRSTYDVDSGDISLILNSHHDVSTVVECDIMLCDNAPANSESYSNLTKSLLERNGRTSKEIEHELRRLITLDTWAPRGMDECIKRVWTGYVPGGQWQALSTPNERWVTTQLPSFGEDEEKTRAVHFNLLTGQLLIDGSPMKRLPSEYVAHPTYLRTFGDVSGTV
jgi:hypothetical protein